MADTHTHGNHLDQRCSSGRQLIALQLIGAELVAYQHL